MRLVELTPEAVSAIASRATGRFRNNARKLPNGNFQVAFDDDTLERLSVLALEGESHSDTMIRLIALQRGMN